MMVVILALMLIAGCSATDANYDSQLFFRPQQPQESHGRKTWLDRLVEVDPGRVSLKLATDYDENPPERIAVLPVRRSQQRPIPSKQDPSNPSQ